MLHKSILLAGEPGLRQLLGNSFLARAGFALLEAEDGREAFVQVEEKDPTLAIFDLDLPGMIECCLKIKADPLLCSTPLILLAPPGLRRDIEPCLEKADALLVKPPSREALMSAVCRLLRIPERTEPRVPVQVRARCGRTIGKWRPVWVVNLAAGGFFLATDALFPAESTIFVELDLPQGPLLCRGRVAWVNHPEWMKKSAFPPGMGVQILHEDAAGRAGLEAFLAGRLGREEPETIGAVLDFWFGEISPDGAVPTARRQLWFGGGETADGTIRRRFGSEVERALRGEFDPWLATPRGTLALILLLDQFPRNIHRGTPLAYAGDERALRLCREGRRQGGDLALSIVERAFFYLPLEHAEDREAQRESVAAFAALLKQAPPALQETCRSFLDYAVRHRDIIERFGHFPHRNAVLGRPSTPEEEDFLKHPGSSF